MITYRSNGDGSGLSSNICTLSSVLESFNSTRTNNFWNSCHSSKHCIDINYNDECPSKISSPLPLESVKDIIVLFGLTLMLHTGSSLKGVPSKSSVGVDASGKNLCFLKIPLKLYSHQQHKMVMDSNEVLECLRREEIINIDRFFTGGSLILCRQ